MSQDVWSAVVDAEQGEDGLFVPVLMLLSPEAEEPLRVSLNGVCLKPFKLADRPSQI